MDAADLHRIVHWTARASAALFSAALVAPALLRSSARGSRRLYLAFVAAHTVHFSFVVWLAKARGGRDMFPGGRSIADAGGWPAVFGIFAFFYALASIGLLARSDWAQGRPAVRVAGSLATGFLGFMFASTYAPLIARSPWYALGAAVVTVAVAVDVLAPLARRLRCLGVA
jgi:hypothetical protein